MRPQTFLSILGVIIAGFALLPVILILRQNNNKVAQEFIEVSLIDSPTTVIHDECALIILLSPSQLNLTLRL